MPPEIQTIDSLNTGWTAKKEDVIAKAREALKDSEEGVDEKPKDTDAEDVKAKEPEEIEEKEAEPFEFVEEKPTFEKRRIDDE